MISIDGNSLKLETKVLGKPCIFDPLVVDNPELLSEIETYFKNGKGCSVATERQSDGSDRIVEVYNKRTA